MTRAVAGVLTQKGTLGGLRGLSASRNLELLPTATAIQLGRLTDTGYVEDDTQPDFGFNMKYGVTSNLTADFTLNPDFSQIEADRPQIETNQRYPLFFPELRPFFLEGQEIFRTPGRTNLVHTKTIVDPQIGGKLTGKTGNTTLGLLVANDAAPGKFDDPGAYGFGETGELRHRTGPLRPLLAVVPRGNHDRPRVSRLVQPRGGCRRSVPPRPDAPGAVPGSHLVTSATSTATP